MVNARPGKTSLGCLFTLLIISAAIYFGVNIADVYWRAYQFEDAIKQEVRFADEEPNGKILIRLRAFADSLQLPPEAAGNLEVLRDRNSITVQSSYSESVELPMTVRDFHFHPRAARSF